MNMKRWGIIAAAVLLVLSAVTVVFGARSEGGGEGVTVLSGVDSELLCAYLDGEQDLFALPATEWVGQDESDATVSEDFSLLGEDAFEGERGLLVTSQRRRANAIRIFEGVLPNAEASAVFTFSILLPAGAEYEVSLTLMSSIVDESVSLHRLRVEKTFAVTGGAWRTVLVDISDFAGRGSIQEIEIEAAGKDGALSFGLDAVGFSSEAGLDRALMYLSGRYEVEGGTLEYAEGMQLFAKGGKASFGASAMPILVNEDERAILVEMTNPTGFKSMTLTYLTVDEEEYTVTRSIESSTSLVQYVYFPLKGETVASLSFSMEGGGGGRVTFHSISVGSFPVGEVTERGEITSCRFDASRSMLEVSGTVKETIRTGGTGGQLGLYVLTGNQTVNDLIYGRCRRLMTTQAGESFSFRVEAGEGALSNRYAVAILRGGEIIPICEPVYISNPEALASESVTLPVGEGKKGGSLALTSVFDGIAFTSIEVKLEKLLTLDRTETAVSIEGGNYYFSTAYLQMLDEQIALCRERGIRALFVLTVSQSEDAALNKLLLHPNVKSEAIYSAFATQSEDGMRYLRAAVWHLAQRYAPKAGDKGGVWGFVVGSNVNDTARYSMGDVTLSEAVRSYAKALRTVYNTALSVSSGYAVYASFDSVWNSSERSHFGTRQFLDAMVELVEREGDFGWQVAFDPYPGQDYYAYADKGARMSFAAQRVTVANLEVLSGYLSRSVMAYERTYRDIVLLERPEGAYGQIADADAYKVGADYAYTYYKILTPNFARVKALIIHHDASYGDTFCLIDTDRSAQVSEYALQVIDAASWQSLLTAFRIENAVVRVHKEGVLTHQTPSSVVGSIVLWDFADKDETGGFGEAYGVSDISGGVTMGEGSYLSVGFAPEGLAGGEIYTMPEKAYDFTLTPYLRFDCWVSGLKEEVKELKLQVTVMSGKNILVSEGVIAPGGQTTIVVDMSEFDQRRAVDCLRVALYGSDGEEMGTPTLLLGQIEGLSDKYAGDELIWEFDRDQNRGEEAEDDDKMTYIMIATLSGAIMVLAILEGIRIVRRRAGGKESENAK